MSELSRTESRLAELGLSLPPMVAPVAAYVPAVVTGNMVYTSGQLPFVDGTLPATGKVSETSTSDAVKPAVAQDLAGQCVLNALAAVKDQIGDLDRIVRVVKVTGFVASEPTFYGQPQVINGASTLLGKIFGDAGVHSRSAVGVSALPMNSPVEVELVVEFA